MAVVLRRKFAAACASGGAAFFTTKSGQWRPFACLIQQHSGAAAAPTTALFKGRILQPGKLRFSTELQRAFRRWNQNFSHNSRFSGYARPDVALWTLIGANVSVFFMWKFFDPVFMTHHFTVSMDNLLSGRLHTLVTNFFSHNEFWHLASNLLGLYFFGTSIAYTFGSRRLYILYFAGGLVSSFGHLAYSYYIYPRLKGLRHSTFVARFVPPALGASGAINTLVVLNIMLNPTQVILVDFLFPVPAALFGAYMIFKDLWGVTNVESSVSHVGHLGGALVGAVAWVRLRRRRW